MNYKKSLRNYLHKMAKQFELELQIEAYPSKDTASLDKSFKSRGYEIIDDDTFMIKCDANYYAKYVNGGKNNQRAKGFITKAVDNVIDRNMSTIIQSQFDSMMFDFNIDSPNNYKKRKI